MLGGPGLADGHSFARSTPFLVFCLQKGSGAGKPTAVLRAGSSFHSKRKTRGPHSKLIRIQYGGQQALTQQLRRCGCPGHLPCCRLCLC